MAGTGMYIELWQGVRDLMHDNSTTGAIDRAKQFVNWTLKDLADEFDWPFLRGDMNLTASAGSGVYILDPIAQVTASGTTFYASAALTADGGSVVTIFGKELSGNSSLVIQSDAITLVATATATGGATFSHIDSIQRAAGSGDINIYTATGATVATLSSSTTYMANDIRKITKVINTSNSEQLFFYDRNTYQRGNPNGSNVGTQSAYDLDYLSRLNLFNVDAASILLLYYQRMPKYLVNNIDRSEFPYELYPKIINACYQGYGLRYQDEQDGQLGKQVYISLLRDIVSAYITGRDFSEQRVMPAQYKRTL